jgi:cytochrome P450
VSALAEPAELTAPPSPAGPLDDDDGRPPRLPPGVRGSRLVQSVRFGLRPLAFNLGAGRDLGETFRVRLLSREESFVVTSHPDHVKSLFTAKPHEQHSLTGESPLRPILGPNSVLTSIGERHMRQRKLLLPAFHGDAVKRYAQMIAEAADREIARWPVGRPFALAPRMQKITLDVILAGVFGVEGTPEPGTPERALRDGIRHLTKLSVHPFWQLVELRNIGHDEPSGYLKHSLERLDRHIYALIGARRAEQDAAERADVLSLLLSARDEEGNPLTDHELRDELMTLLLAGHETTANSLAWAFERLLRFPAAYERLREETRSDGGGEDYVEATIYEAMRVRPVIPLVVRRVNVPWQLGEYRVPAGTPVAMSIVLLHHRPDIYPEPYAFRPERFLDREPGTYTWIPFGGGIRRCLGASLAMAEQKIVLRAVARRTDMVAPEAAPEGARQRNVTMIPRRGTRVVITARHA